MSPTAADRHARKQLLLTRIALQRAELRSELTRAGEAARLPNLLRSVDAGQIGRSLFGVGSQPGHGGWIGLALSLLRRYRVAAALLGAAAPLLRRGGLRRVVRVVRIGGFVAAAWFGWRVVRSRIDRA